MSSRELWSFKTSFFACFNRLKQPAHILCDILHSCNTFCIFIYIFRFTSKDFIPIIGRYNRHMRNTEMFVDNIHACHLSSTSCTKDTSSRFIDKDTLI